MKGKREKKQKTEQNKTKQNKTTTKKQSLHSREQKDGSGAGGGGR